MSKIVIIIENSEIQDMKWEIRIGRRFWNRYYLNLRISIQKLPVVI